VETELLLSPIGEVNELFGTEPDVKLPSASPPRSITRDDLLQDAWIKEIISPQGRDPAGDIATALNRLPSFGH
jgi:hypothetical protein